MSGDNRSRGRLDRGTETGDSECSIDAGGDAAGSADYLESVVLRRDVGGGDFDRGGGIVRVEYTGNGAIGPGGKARAAELHRLTVAICEVGHDGSAGNSGAIDWNGSWVDAEGKPTEAEGDICGWSENSIAGADGDGVSSSGRGGTCADVEGNLRVSAREENDAGLREGALRAGWHSSALEVGEGAGIAINTLEREDERYGFAGCGCDRGRSGDFGADQSCYAGSEIGIGLGEVGGTCLSVETGRDCQNVRGIEA